MEAAKTAYDDIKDAVGVRVACQYLSEIKKIADSVFWSLLLDLGYLDPRKSDSVKFKEKDYVTRPEPETSYRGFHLYLQIPTEIDIYGNKQMVLCEVQIRTEIQHVWSTRSHDQVFKPKGEVSPDDLLEMSVISDQLHGSDFFLDKLQRKLVFV